MEVCITKKLFLTVDIPDNLSYEDTVKAIKEEIKEHDDIDEWDEIDWRGKEVYEAYETYGGTDIDLEI